MCEGVVEPVKSDCSVCRAWFSYRSKWKCRNTFTVSLAAVIVKTGVVKVLQDASFSALNERFLTLVKRVRDDGVFNQDFEWNNRQSCLVGRLKHDRATCPGLLDLKPSRSADAPAIAGFEARKAKLWHGRAEVVAEELGDAEELFVDDAADGVDAEVVRTGLAAAGAVEACHGLAAADLERLAKNISSASFDGLLDGFGSRHPVVSLPVKPSIPRS